VDPYQTLGVSRDAPPEAVRRAYRKKAKKTHPDHGGDAESFHALQLAYEVLSDPDRRARFDRTGATEKETVPPAEVEFVHTVRRFLLDLVAELVKNGEKVENEDVLVILKNRLSQELLETEAELAGMRIVQTQLAEAAGRFEREGDGDNVLASLARFQAAEVGRGIERRELRKNLLAKGLETLKGYRYRRDAPPTDIEFVKRGIYVFDVMPPWKGKI
jgi:curved DNA-binding protein CbpA